MKLCSLYQIYNEDLFDATATNDLRKKTEFKTLLVRTLSASEADIPKELKAEVTVNYKHKTPGYSYSKNLSYVRSFIFSKTNKLMDIHLFFFKLYKNLY